MFYKKLLVYEAGLFRITCYFNSLSKTFRFFARLDTSDPPVKNVQDFFKCVKCISLRIKNEFFLRIVKFEQLYTNFGAIKNRHFLTLIFPNIFIKKFNCGYKWFELLAKVIGRYSYEVL